MNNWYDKLDRTEENVIRCFVSLSHENPLDNEKLITANIWSRREHTNSNEVTFTEVRSGNHYRYAIPCEDALPTFLDEYLESIGGDIATATFNGYFEFIHKKPIDGMFYVPDMEAKYNDLIEKKKDFMLFCEVMDGYEQCMREEHDKDIGVFNEEVLPLLNEEQLEELKVCMEDSLNGSYRITDKPCVASKDDDYNSIDVHVHQWQNGGDTGDDFAGTISVALPNGKYFTFDYQC